MSSKIEWTEETLTMFRARVKPDAAEIAFRKGYRSLVQIAEKMAGRVGPHCEHVSPGCTNCYSETNNGRCLPVNGTGLPFDLRSRDLVDIFIDENMLHKPLKRKQPTLYFINSQTDTFAEFITDEMLDQLFAVMAKCQQHTFQILTKRAERMLHWAKKAYTKCSDPAGFPHPYRNVWLGVSVEDQRYADERIPFLLRTPAAVRFVSYEPALGPVDFTRISPNGLCYANALTGVGFDGSTLDWLIVGGESGPGARSCDVDWIRSAVHQCKATGVPVFCKQLGRKPLLNGGKVRLRHPKGGDIAEWPGDFQVREMPRTSRTQIIEAQ